VCLPRGKEGPKGENRGGGSYLDRGPLNRQTSGSERKISFRERGEAVFEGIKGKGGGCEGGFQNSLTSSARSFPRRRGPRDHLRKRRGYVFRSEKKKKGRVEEGTGKEAEKARSKK